MPPELIAAIATAGAKALVAAMGTDTWGTVRSKLVKILHRRSNKLAMLDQANRDVEYARSSGQGDGLDAINNKVHSILEEIMANDASTIEKFRTLCSELGAGIEIASVQGTQTAYAQDEAQQAVQYYGTQKNEFTRDSKK